MQKFCLGFEVHQPYRLKREFVPFSDENPEDDMDRYFDPANREILIRVCEKCYGPATEMILDQLDEGFHCAFSLSGVLIEQLERWAPDVLDLFIQAVSHQNVEMLAQTYFHSISSLFWTMDEFAAQVKMHRDLVRDIFGCNPAFFENTEFLFDNRIAGTVKSLGFSGCFTEGVDTILKWRTPNYVYACQGLPVIMRNFKLSDDIAFRFTCRDWEAFPLTADKYACWVSRSPGDFVQVFIDYETIGEHYWADTGIFEFFRHLGQEMRNAGVEMVNPSDLLEYPVRDEFSIPLPISWADAEKDSSAWVENRKQKNAFRSIQRAQTFCCNTHTWRSLQISDHFYYMSCKNGSCGEVHQYFSHQEEHHAFITYMDVLADYQVRCIDTSDQKEFLRPLRSVSIDDAFYFSSPVGYTGHVAFDLDQLVEMLQIVPNDSIEYHLDKGDIQTWCRSVIGDEPLAAGVGEAKNRQELITAADDRRKQLWNVLQEKT